MTILVAEDDGFTRKGLVDIFESEGYTVIEAEDGDRAVELFKRDHPDLVFLDIMMPKKNGYDVCRSIRKADLEVPVIFLSAKSEEIDKVLGLELGADDYIAKPFGVKEVIARVRAVTRRVNRTRVRSGGKGDSAAGTGGCGDGQNREGSGDGGETKGGSGDGSPRSPRDRAGVQEEAFDLHSLRVYPAELKAVREGKEIELSLRDVKLLSLFAANLGKVLDRDTLYDAGWGIRHLPNSRTLDQHISQLRKKIEVDPKDPKIILTVHTAGYRCSKEEWHGNGTP
jgi:DNA-binding response OmpR family regulator